MSPRGPRNWAVCGLCHTRQGKRVRGIQEHIRTAHDGELVSRHSLQAKGDALATVWPTEWGDNLAWLVNAHTPQAKLHAYDEVVTWEAAA